MRKLLIAAIALELLLISACGAIVQPQPPCTRATADEILELESGTVLWCDPRR